MALKVNPQMQVIKIKDDEFILKKGTMSNYSFDVKDDIEDGLLNKLVLDNSLYPNNVECIVKKLVGVKVEWTEKRIKSALKKLTDINFLEDKTDSNTKVKLLILEDDLVNISDDIKKMLSSRLKTQKVFLLSKRKEKIERLCFKKLT